MIFAITVFRAEINDEDIPGYRLYDVELIEISNLVSMLVLLPPSDQISISLNDACQLVNEKEHIMLPLQVFETCKLLIGIFIGKQVYVMSYISSIFINLHIP